MIRGIAGRTYHIIENLMSRVISFLLKPTPSLKSDKWLFFSSLLHLCYHSNGKVELIRDFYTLVIVQINKFVKNNFYIFAHTCRVGGGGGKKPLNAQCSFDCKHIYHFKNVSLGPLPCVLLASFILSLDSN